MTGWLRARALFWILLLTWVSYGQTGKQDNIRYLVIRRAGRPEKNYYELAKRVSLSDVDDVITEEPSGIRYGVHAIWKVGVKRITDSQKYPESPSDAYYVLIYERDPETRFCAEHYRVSVCLKEHAGLTTRTARTKGNVLSK